MRNGETLRLVQMEKRQYLRSCHLSIFRTILSFANLISHITSNAKRVNGACVGSQWYPSKRKYHRVWEAPICRSDPCLLRYPKVQARPRPQDPEILRERSILYDWPNWVTANTPYVAFSLRLTLSLESVARSFWPSRLRFRPLPMSSSRSHSTSWDFLLALRLWFWPSPMTIRQTRKTDDGEKVRPQSGSSA